MLVYPTLYCRITVTLTIAFAVALLPPFIEQLDSVAPPTPRARSRWNWYGLRRSTCSRDRITEPQLVTIEIVQHLPQGVPDTVPRLSQLGVVITHLTPKVNPYDKLVVSNELEPSLVI